MADFLWVEKYRPKTVKDCILSNDLKKTLFKHHSQKTATNTVKIMFNDI